MEEKEESGDINEIVFLGLIERNQFYERLSTYILLTLAFLAVELLVVLHSVFLVEIMLTTLAFLEEEEVWVRVGRFVLIVKLKAQVFLG